MKNCEICQKLPALYHISVRLLQDEKINRGRYQDQRHYGDEILKTNVCGKCLAYKNIKEVTTVEQVEKKKLLG
jgi:hypothetical protein